MRLTVNNEEDLRSKAFFVCKDARGSEEISNLALADVRLTVNNEEGLRSKAFFVCKDARGSEEISNLAL